MAIDKDNTVAMNNLGYYYQDTEKNYDLMKQYYLMAIDKDNTDAMYNLGLLLSIYRKKLLKPIINISIIIMCIDITTTNKINV
jgi:TPR repeat protein